jgi:hypothetical protein
VPFLLARQPRQSGEFSQKRKVWTVEPKAESCDFLVSWYRHAAGNKAKLLAGIVVFRFNSGWLPQKEQGEIKVGRTDVDL